MRKRIRRRMFPLVASVASSWSGCSPAPGARRRAARSRRCRTTCGARSSRPPGSRQWNIGGLYAPPTGLISLPGAAVILLPCAALISALRLSLAIPGPANLHPAVWLLAGPYQIAIGCLPLFAADALAERLEVPRWTRGLLALAGAGVLWSVCARWGHPEDAVAVGLLLYAVLAQGNGRTARGGLAGRGGGLRPAAGAAGAADHARPAAVAADAGRSWSAPPCRRPCWWRRPRSPTGTTPTSR